MQLSAEAQSPLGGRSHSRTCSHSHTLTIGGPGKVRVRREGRQGAGVEAALAAASSWGTSIFPLGPEAWGQAHVHTPIMGISPGRPLRWELPGGTCSGNTPQASYQPAKCLISPLESLLRVVTEVSDTRVTCCNRHPGSSWESDAGSEAEETVLQMQLGVWEPPQHADALGWRRSLF